MPTLRSSRFLRAAENAEAIYRLPGCDAIFIGPFDLGFNLRTADGRNLFLIHSPRAVRGGLVDGPVYEHIFKSLKGVAIREPDPLAAFQGGFTELVARTIATHRSGQVAAC